MAVKRLTTIKPTATRLDKKGRPIAIYRGGILDTNKYARKSPLEKEMEANLNNKDYTPKGVDKP